MAEYDDPRGRRRSRHQAAAYYGDDRNALQHQYGQALPPSFRYDVDDRNAVQRQYGQALPPLLRYGAVASGRQTGDVWHERAGQAYQERGALQPPPRNYNLEFDREMFRIDPGRSLTERERISREYEAKVSAHAEALRTYEERVGTMRHQRPPRASGAADPDTGNSKKEGHPRKDQQAEEGFDRAGERRLNENGDMEDAAFTRDNVESSGERDQSHMSRSPDRGDDSVRRKGVSTRQPTGTAIDLPPPPSAPQREQSGPFSMPGVVPVDDLWDASSVAQLSRRNPSLSPPRPLHIDQWAAQGRGEPRRGYAHSYMVFVDDDVPDDSNQAWRRGCFIDDLVESDDEENGSTAQAPHYSFKSAAIERAGRSDHANDGAHDQGGKPESSGQCSPSPRPDSGLQGTLDCIVHSVFKSPRPEDGDGHDDANDFAEVRAKFFSFPRTPLTTPKALFYVKHIQQDAPTLESFEHAILAVPELHPVRNAIRSHFRKVWGGKRSHPVKGAATPLVEPFLEVERRQGLAIKAACIPYVYRPSSYDTTGEQQRNTPPYTESKGLLQRLFSGWIPGQQHARLSGSVAAQTLFQYLHPTAHRKADKSQTVCQMLNLSERHCLCVAQLWVLIIDNALVLSCSVLGQQELYANYQVHIRDPLDDSVSARYNLPNLRVEGPNGTMYLLRQEQCKTYLDFVSHFSDVTHRFQRDIKIQHCGHEVAPHEWDALVASSSSRELHVKLERRPPQEAFVEESRLSAKLRSMMDPLDNALRTSAGSTLQEYVVSCDELAKVTMTALLRPTALRGPVSARDRGPGGRYPGAANSSNVSFGQLIDGDILSVCGEMSYTQFCSRLQLWCQEHSGPGSDPNNYLEDPGASLDPAGGHDTATGNGRRYHSLASQSTAALYGRLLNAVRVMTRVFGLGSGCEPTAIERKLLAGALDMITTMPTALAQRPVKWAKSIAGKVFSPLLVLLDVVIALEVYDFDKKTCDSKEVGKAHAIQEACENAAIAFHLAAGLLRRLDQLLSSVDVEGSQSTLFEQLLRLEASIATMQGMNDDEPSGYGGHADVRDPILVTQRERLARLKHWRADSEDPHSSYFALSIVQARIEKHGRLAEYLLRKAFRAVLIKRRPRKALLRTPAHTSDLLLCLISRASHLPVIGEEAESPGSLHANYDIYTMYLKYFEQLGAEIAVGDPSREPAERLRHLKHELNAIAQIQAAQSSVCRDLIGEAFAKSQRSQARKAKVSRGHKFVLPNSPLVKKCQDDIGGDRELIEQLTNAIDVMHADVIAKLESNDDWRNNAGVVFTVITVIFSPFAFVASVFGMNTADIANLSFGQWIFWASAAPFTLLVIAVTLWFVDVPPLRRWLERRKGGE